MKIDEQTLDYILMFLMASLIGAILIGFLIVDKNAIKCLANPVLYYEHMKNVSCICAKELPKVILP